MSIDIVDLLNKAVIGLEALGNANPGPDVLDLAAVGVAALRDVIVAVEGAGIRHVSPGDVQADIAALQAGEAANAAAADAAVDAREQGEAPEPDPAA